MRSYRTMLCLVGTLFLCSASDSGYAQGVTLPDIDVAGSPNGIVTLPSNVPQVFREVFVKYTKVIAPNGKPIHFLVQDAWSDDKILKARKIMEHFLTSYPGSRYGDDKTTTANAMADVKATMTLFNTSVEARSARANALESGVTDLAMQSLWENETTAEGSDDYMNQVTRDAAYEEVLHLVQTRGIMTALPEFQQELEAANVEATARGWDPSNNNSVEYFAQQFDVYIDMWAVQPTRWEGTDARPGQFPEGTAHGGQNRANTRARLLEDDPVAYELEESFFPPYLTYTPLLPVDFEGTFSIALDTAKRYTYKSQHLRKVTLRGDNDAQLVGNRHENVLTGNAGDNILTGGEGGDRLNGNGGDDTAVYSGTRAEYRVTKHDGFVTVADKRLNRDGTDTLTSVEALRFRDEVVGL